MQQNDNLSFEYLHRTTRWLPLIGFMVNRCINFKPTVCEPQSVTTAATVDPGSARGLETEEQESLSPLIIGRDVP